MKRLTLALFVILLASSPRSAAAYDVSWGRLATNASYVYLEQIWIDARTTTTFMTANLSGGGDTVMFLYRPDIQTQVAKNDDYSGGGLASKITYTSGSVGASYSLIVMAYNAESAGTCDVYKDGRAWRSNVPFAGQPVSIGPASVGAGANIRTAERTGGVIDTVLFAFDGSKNLRQINDDDYGGSGRRSDNVGLMSRLEPTVTTTSVVIGTYGQWESGPVWLIVNDASADTDGDGLGPQLEESLCTCDYASQNTCGLPCSGLATTADSDGDGIADDWEVYGANGIWTDFDQPLARWGANPAHKDVFVELDWRNLGEEMHPNNLQVAATAYAALGSATRMANRDGVGGIAVHFDIGATFGGLCTSTLCGDWGGANRDETGTWTNPTAQNFVLARQGIFHRGITGGAQGLTHNDVFTTSYNHPYGVPHELGHNLGLVHGGRESAADYNGKPNYHSIMNYAFQDYAGFSTGLEVPLNPTNICESVGLYTSCGAIAHLGPNTRHGYLLQQLPGHPFCGIDWNRDGVVTDCNTVVEAAPNYLIGGEAELGRYYWEWEHTAAFTPAVADPDLFATPSMARTFGRLHIAHRTNATSGGNLTITYTADSFRRLCEPINGYAETAVGCASWTRHTTLPDVAVAESGPALVKTPTGALLVVYRSTTGIRWKTLDVSSNYAMLASGTVANSADARDEPVVAVGPDGKPRLIFRTGSGATGPVFMTTFDMTFSTPAQQFENVGGIYTPMFVETVNALAPGRGPTGPELMVVVGRATGTTHELAWLRFEDQQVGWVDNGTVVRGDLTSPVTRRVGLAYRSTFGSGSGITGRYYVIHAQDGNAAQIRMTRGNTNPAANRLEWVPATSWGSYYDNGSRSTHAGVALLAWEPDQTESNLRYAGIFNGHIDFKPFADGIIPIWLKDSKDWEIVEAGICASIQPDGCNSSLCKPCLDHTGPPTVQW